MRALIDAGHEAVHWSVIGSVSAKDGEICDHCLLHDYVLLTSDLDSPRSSVILGTPRL